MGATGFSLPDYRGADQSRSYVFPLPYLVYRGEVFRIGREGIRGVLLESERAELDISLYGTPPVNSDRNRARQGMQDLDPTFEVGPRLNLTLWRERKTDQRLELRFPLRAVFATDLSYVRHAGYLFYPHVQLDLRPAFLEGKWNLGLQSGPLYSTSKHHQYFYGVDPQFATAARPAYAARGGYSGTLALVSISRRFRDFWVGGFVRYDALQGAAFEDSPLVKRRHSVMAGVALAWIFARSGRIVESDD